jgi:hypothetical protein
MRRFPGAGCWRVALPARQAWCHEHGSLLIEAALAVPDEPVGDWATTKVDLDHLDDIRARRRANGR